MSTYRIAVLVGSLRQASWTRKVALAMQKLAPPSLAFEFVEFGDLPAYNQEPDEAGSPPAEWVRFRDAIRPVHGLLFLTPEYNRGVPGFLKNAIDVGSRPYGKSVWSKKPAAIVSVSPGLLGGVLANHSLRQPMVFLDVPLLQQPEAYIGNVASLFDEAGELKSDDTRKFFTNFVNAFAVWVERLQPQ